MDLSTQKKYRVFMDESYKFEKDPEARKDKTWYYELHGKLGIIFRYGWDGSMAATYVSRYQNKAMALIKANKWTVRQNGDIELTFVFPAVDLDKAAHLIQARRKRKPISEERRQAAAERFAKYRESLKKTNHKATELVKI